MLYITDIIVKVVLFHRTSLYWKVSQKNLTVIPTALLRPWWKFYFFSPYWASLQQGRLGAHTYQSKKCMFTDLRLGSRLLSGSLNSLINDSTLSPCVWAGLFQLWLSLLSNYRQKASIQPANSCWPDHETARQRGGKEQVGVNEMVFSLSVCFVLTLTGPRMNYVNPAAWWDY